MTLRPVSLEEANAFVASFHRHNGKVVGHRFSIGLEHDGELVGKPKRIGSDVALREAGQRDVKDTGSTKRDGLLTGCRCRHGSKT